MRKKIKALKYFFMTKHSTKFEDKSERLFFKFLDDFHAFLLRVYVAFALLVVGIFVVDFVS